jgi:membrane-associated phospholipid phosphatase
MGTGPTDVASAEILQRAPATRPWARTTALTAYAALFVLWSELLGIPRGTLQVFAWLWLGTIAWHVEAEPRYHLNFVRDWWPPVVGLLIYFYSRGLTDDLGLPVHFSLPISVDAWLGGGRTPTERLQAAWCGDPCGPGVPPRWYDVVLTTVYMSHFLAGLAIAAVLWLRDRVAWVRWMRRYVTINFGALVIYILYPMAPPWMAAERGYLPPDVHQITGRGWSGLGMGHLDVTLQGVGNPVAAMPSLHAGMTVLIALYAIQRLRSRWRWLLLAYPVAMSTALVYFGEHYVVDVLAGALLAMLVLLGCKVWEDSRGT